MMFFVLYVRRGSGPKFDRDLLNLTKVYHRKAERKGFSACWGVRWHFLPGNFEN